MLIESMQFMMEVENKFRGSRVTERLMLKGFALILFLMMHEHVKSMGLGLVL